MATATKDVQLISHLMRRAGFGAGLPETESLAQSGYQETLHKLLNPTDVKEMPDDMIRRYHHEQSGMMGQNNPGAYWLYKMITTSAPLVEKMALFWHGIFATGYPKITQGKVLSDQIRMFRHYGMGNFRTLLLELSKDPAMIVWLDNHDNHDGSINENFGRELLELFSMGVGNYSEQDIRETARAFTGWTIGNTEYMALRAERDSIWPYGRIAWHFEFKEDDHDDGEKEFLGNTGRLNGDEIIDIICQQESTARFISRHMYHFFVADEPPVPQWPYTPPRDPDAIDLLTQAYFDSNYDIRSMLEVLFNSDAFKSEDSWYERVKSPVELVAGVLRLTGEFERPRREILDRASQTIFMGQHLINPPSVEGWHQGTEWIDTGTLVERLNFASQQMANTERPGVAAIITRIIGDGSSMSDETLVQRCLDEMGAIAVSDDTRSILENFAAKSRDLDDDVRENVGQMLQMVGATHEFQRA
jgi:uncharacterized protein (DUF1800 family)